MTFWKPHYFPGIPKDYYSPKFVYAGDMLPKKGQDIDNEPDCRELVRACLARKSSQVRNQVEEWIEKNQYILYDEISDDLPTSDVAENNSKKEKRTKGNRKAPNKKRRN